MVGRMKCAQVPEPETGSQRNCTENSMISTSAKKKFGIACPTTATPSDSRSIQPP